MAPSRVVASLSRASTTTTTSSTTSTSTSTTTTTTTTLAPVLDGDDLPEVGDGEAVAIVDGSEQQVSTRRINNEIVVTVGNLKAVVGAKDVDGRLTPLSENGAVSLDPGGSIDVRLEGLAPDSEVSGLLYSEPVRLGTQSADKAGKLDASFKIPTDMEDGNHRFVIAMEDVSGRDVLLTFGVEGIGTTEGVGVTAIVLIVLGLGMAVALFLPSALRRRRTLD